MKNKTLERLRDLAKENLISEEAAKGNFICSICQKPVPLESRKAPLSVRCAITLNAAKQGQKFICLECAKWRERIKNQKEKSFRAQGKLVVQYQTIYEGTADFQLEQDLGDAIYKAVKKHGWQPDGGLILMAGIDEIKGTKELRFYKKEKKKKKRRWWRSLRAISIVRK